MNQRKNESCSLVSQLVYITLPIWFTLLKLRQSDCKSIRQNSHRCCVSKYRQFHSSTIFKLFCQRIYILFIICVLWSESNSAFLDKTLHFIFISFHAFSLKTSFKVGQNVTVLMFQHAFVYFCWSFNGNDPPFANLFLHLHKKLAKMWILEVWTVFKLHW